MDFGISGKTAYVTGGAGGIGYATSKALAQMGVRVVLLDLDHVALVDRKKQLEQEVDGSLVYIISCDVTNFKEVNDKFKNTAIEFGGCDILFNIAGFSRDGYLARMSEDAWDAVHNVVLKAAFNCSRAVLPNMMEKKWGRIINMSSMSYHGNRGQTNYSAAKAGLVGFTKALAREAGSFGITANAIAPGLVATPRLQARADFENLKERTLAIAPIKRLVEPEDVANLALFLASSNADMISAQVIEVAGGG